MDEPSAHGDRGPGTDPQRLRVPLPPSYPPNVPAPRGLQGWWHRHSAGTKTFILTLVGGLVLAGLSGPLGPTLTDLGQRINPFGGEADELKIVAEVPVTPAEAGWIIPGKTYQDVAPVPPVDQRPVPPEEVRAWERRHGAIPSGRQVLRLSLQGGSTKAVTIHRMDVTAGCRRPATGIHIVVPGSGGLPSRFFHVLLDAAGGPVVTPYGKTGVENPNAERASFPFYVTESELEYFVIDVEARSHQCTWKATLHWSVDGRRAETVIGDGDPAFRLTAPTAASSRYRPDGRPLPLSAYR